MKSLLDRLSGLNDVLVRWALWLSALGLIAMTAITGWQVFGRYVLNDSPQWVERTTLLLVLYFTFLAGAVGVREESHLGIAFINDMLPSGVRKTIMVLVGAILAAFGAILVWNGILLVKETWDVATPIIKIPEGATYFAIPFGGILILLFAIELALREFLGEKANRSRQMALWILFGVFFVLIAFNVPIAFALGIAAAATILYDGIPLMVEVQRIASGISVFSLLAIPFFIYAGEIMLYGGIAERLVKFANSVVGHIRGGLGLVNVLASMLFGGISGSAVADTSALGAILIPLMKKKGFGTDYAVNVTVTASVTGILIPPSHNMIIYSLAAGGGVSVAALFMAGIIPGILTGLCLMIAAYLVAVKRGYPKDQWPGWSSVWVSFLGAFPGLFATVIIIGGTLSGIFTVTESAAVAAIYALLVTLFVYKSMSRADFWKATINATKTTAMVMLLIGTASAFGYVLALHQVPAKTIELMHGISDNPYVILFIINVILLILGCIMDMAGLILICTPIFLPVVKSIGMDPVQFGMLVMLNLGLGLCTPPVGTCLFVGCSIGKIRIEETVKTIWPFYLAMFVALMLVTYVPAVSLWVPYTLLK